MNHKKIILFAFVIILLAAGVLFGIKMSIPGPIDSQITEQPNSTITSVTAHYVSEIGEEATVTYYSNDMASLDFRTEYRGVELSIAISGSGARYENTDLKLVVWEKAPELTIYKNDQPIFSGKKIEKVAQDQILKILPAYKWVWSKTFIRNGLDSKPNKPDAFVLTFKSDGTVSGTTDCNSFSGTYTIDSNNIKFGSFMSTLMFCEGSQEQEFISMIKDGPILISDEELLLENDKTVYFKRGEEVK